MRSQAADSRVGFWPASSAAESQTTASSPCRQLTGGATTTARTRGVNTAEITVRWIKDNGFFLWLAGYINLGKSIRLLKLLLIWDCTVGEPVFKLQWWHQFSMNSLRIRRVFANIYNSLASRCLTAFYRHWWEKFLETKSHMWWQAGDKQVQRSYMTSMRLAEHLKV